MFLPRHICLIKFINFMVGVRLGEVSNLVLSLQKMHFLNDLLLLGAPQNAYLSRQIVILANRIPASFIRSFPSSTILSGNRNFYLMKNCMSWHFLKKKKIFQEKKWEAVPIWNFFNPKLVRLVKFFFSKILDFGVIFWKLKFLRLCTFTETGKLLSEEMFHLTREKFVLV